MIFLKKKNKTMIWAIKFNQNVEAWLKKHLFYFIGMLLSDVINQVFDSKFLVALIMPF